MGGRGALAAVCGLGLVAAVCAALLMAALRAGPSSAGASQAATVDVVVATEDLPANTPLREQHLSMKPIARESIAEGAYGDAANAVGRVLLRPLVAGQLLTSDALVPEDSGARLAMSLPAGVRAVAIELDASDAMVGLVYPGSSVDVLMGTSSRRSGDGSGSRTLLQHVRVLAVENRTVFSEEQSADDDEDRGDADPRQASRRNKKLMVTLMVTPDQARTLQSARGMGSLSLSLRNPTDSTKVDEGSDDAERRRNGPQAVEEPTAEPSPQMWTTTVHRGGSTEVHTFGRGVGGDTVEPLNDASNRAQNTRKVVPESPDTLDDPPSEDDR